MTMTPISAFPPIYDAPRLAHEWWRDTLPTVPSTRDWEEVIALVERLEDGVSLAVLRGRPGQDLRVPSPGTHLFGMQVLLEGELDIELEHGPLCQPPAGSLILFHYSDNVRSQIRLNAGRDVYVVDVRFSREALARASAFPVAQHMQGRFSDYSVPQRGGLLVFCAANKALLDLAASLVRAPIPDGPALNLWRRAKAHEMLAHVIALLAGADGGAALSGIENEKLDGAFTLLQEEYGKDWSVAALARAAGLPEKKLQAGFRARAGMSVYAFLRHTRLAAAADQLGRGRNVTDAALAVGYGNMSHFSKAFRRQFGVSPKAYKCLAK
jgi:AraC-like DNA-binding protein